MIEIEGTIQDPAVRVTIDRIVRFLIDNVGSDGAVALESDDAGRLRVRYNSPGLPTQAAYLELGQVLSGAYRDTLTPVNLVLDSRFELTVSAADTAYWDFDGATKVWGATLGYEGGAGAALLGGTSLLQQTFRTVHDADRYVLSCRLTAEAGFVGTAAVFLRGYDKNFQSLGYEVGSAAITPTGAWKQWASFVTLDHPQIAYAKVGLVVLGTGGLVYFDDVQGEPLPTKLFALAMNLGSTFDLSAAADYGEPELLNVNQTAAEVTFADAQKLEDLQPAEAGADVTSTHIAAGIAGQGSLATKNVTDIKHSEITDDEPAQHYDWTNETHDLVTTGKVQGGTGHFGGATHYSEFEADGTLKFNGDSTPWVDIQFPISSGKLGAANNPTWEAFTTNTSAYSFAVNDYIDLAGEEPPHGWKEGSSGSAHIHLAIRTDQSTGADRYAKFTVYFAYADINDVWTETSLTAEYTIPTGTLAKTHKLLALGTLDLSGLGVGAQLKARVKRTAATGGTEYGDRVFVTQVGVHVECDTVGSRTAAAK